MEEKQGQLERKLGAGTLAISGINLTIGAGIFALPALVAAQLGPASFIAYLGCGVLISLVMLCFAEMGSRVPGTGGAYAYIESTFGPLAGFLTNTLLWFGWEICHIRSTCHTSLFMKLYAKSAGRRYLQIRFTTGLVFIFY